MRPQRARAGGEAAQREADGQTAGEGHEERRERVAVVQGQRGGNEEGEAEDGEQGADEAADGTPVDPHQRRQ